MPATPTPCAQLAAAIATGYRPGANEIADLMTALHAATLDTPLMNWLDVSFEDMADTVTRADACAQREEEEMAVTL